MLGAAVGSVVTYVITRKSETIEVGPIEAHTADARDERPKQDAGDAD
jgi:hypothetical protein